MRRILLVAGGMAVLVVLAAAAFVAGRMWRAETAPGSTSIGALHVISSGGESKGATLIAKLETAGELPQRPPDTVGVFTRREDNRIFVSSSNEGIMYTLDGEVTSAGDATEVEVVVTGETFVYEDLTQEDLGNGLPSGQTIEQKLEPGQVDEIGRNSVVMAWGEKRGERLVAEILVYTGPPVIVR